MGTAAAPRSRRVSSGQAASRTRALAAPRSRLWQRLYQYRVNYLLLLPAVAVVAVFAYRTYPWVLMSFQDFTFKRGLFGSDWVGLLHFEEMFSNPLFHRAVRNTLVINALTFLVGVPAPVVFALLLNELRHRLFKRVTQTITYLPHFLSWVITAGLFYQLLNVDTGLINLAISRLGLQPVAFFREPELFWPIMVSVSVWKEVGWTSIIYLGALSAINSELYEAATIDGANRWQQVWHVTVPGLMGTVAVILILTAGQIIRGGGIIPDFEAIFNMRNPLVAMRSDTVAVHTYLEGVVHSRYAYGTAVGLAESVFALVAVVSANWLAKRFRGSGVF